MSIFGTTCSPINRIVCNVSSLGTPTGSPKLSWSAPACSQRLHWVSTSSGSPQINSSSSTRSSTNSGVYSGSVSGHTGKPSGRGNVSWYRNTSEGR